MKHLVLVATLLMLAGCNTMTKTADKISDKHSSFSQKENTIYPTVDGTKDGEPANFGKQVF
ncbi:hypothetical protein ACGTJS_07975 [Faucicola mancuniensis]|uniref:hypothetical protein n=1 Tax=Faucicola mancuniensis TaxID=1309795 RepID=UPI0028EF7D89|nr:hypothetical protein [uncultured Moraxella sp.]